MKIKKYCGVLLLCLAISLVAGKDLNILEDAVFPIGNMALAALAIPPPLGPCLGTGLGMLQLASQLIAGGTAAANGDVKKAEAISKVNLLEIETKLENAIKKVENSVTTLVLNQAEKIIRVLSHVVETNDFFVKFRNTLLHLAALFTDNIQIVLNNKITGLQKNLTLIELQKSDGYSRRKMRSFVDNFIKPNYDLHLDSSPTKMFFEYLLERDDLYAASGGERLDSVHHAVFKSFMYISKTLTESYVLVLLAHIKQYQKEIGELNFSDAEGTKYISETIINEYKKSMKTLIEKTKWALENSSREIRNSEKFVLEKGKTFESLPVVQILPRIMNMVETDVFYYKCFEDQRYVNFTNYEVIECNGYSNDIPYTSRLQIAASINDRNRPFSYMKFEKPDGTQEVFGHNNSDPYPIIIPTRTFEQCHTVFCEVFKKNAFAISTQRVKAKPEYVITGMRFRVRKNVLYIDIQQAKFVDAISVDPATLEWTETPESDQFVYLSSNTRKIELGDFELGQHLFLTGIQLNESFLRKGVIKIFIYGSSPDNWAKSSRFSFEDKVLELYELNISGSDDPERADVNLRKIISKPPVKDKPYSVKFQATDLKKDFGRTTCPMIDIREVASSPPAPLGGFGIQHEAADGTCGLIALKLLAPKLTDLIDYTLIEQFANTALKI